MNWGHDLLKQPDHHGGQRITRPSDAPPQAARGTGRTRAGFSPSALLALCPATRPVRGSGSAPPPSYRRTSPLSLCNRPLPKKPPSCPCLFCLLTSAITMPQGKGFFVCEEAKKPSLEGTSRAPGVVR